jgi:hypothetical protein
MTLPCTDHTLCSSILDAISKDHTHCLYHFILLRSPLPLEPYISYLEQNQCFRSFSKQLLKMTFSSYEKELSRNLFYCAVQLKSVFTIELLLQEFDPVVDLDTLFLFIENIDPKIVSSAALMFRIILKMILQNMCPDIISEELSRLLDHCVICNRTEYVKELFQIKKYIQKIHSKLVTSIHLTAATESQIVDHGNLDLMTLLHRHGYPYSHNLVNSLCWAGHGHMVREIYHHDCNNCARLQSSPLSYLSLEGLIHHRDLITFSYFIRKSSDIHTEMEFDILEQGDVSFLRYLCHIGHPFDLWSLLMCLENNYVECFRYLIDIGCDFDSQLYDRLQLKIQNDSIKVNLDDPWWRHFFFRIFPRERSNGQLVEDSQSILAFHLVLDPLRDLIQHKKNELLVQSQQIYISLCIDYNVSSDLCKYIIFAFL